MIGIINYGTGNIRSIANTLNRLNTEYVLTNNPTIIQECSKIILPGVGDAHYAMELLKDKQLDSVIKQLKQPVLGICLGMQLLCKHSQENNTECLGVFNNNVVKFNRIGNYKIPHVGWNTLSNNESELFKDIPQDSYVYFVHSYYANTNINTISTTNYICNFSAALKKDNFYGCQFHPEKSGDIGIQIIKNFLNIKN